MAQPQHIAIGRLGEDIVAGYLYNRGFRIIARNYRKPWGELDIVAQKDGVLHFVEVKAGSWSRATWPKNGEDVHRPEEHMHAGKYKRMRRIIDTYLKEHRIGQDEHWTADLAVVVINKLTRKARVRWIWGLLL